MQIIYIPTIVLITYLFGEIFKVIFKSHQDLYKLIPIFVSFLGGILGIIIYLTNKDIINVSNIFEAITIGIISGSSSTGCNQIIKQVFSNYE